MMKSIRTCLLPLLLCCPVLTGCQGAEAQPLSFSLDDVPAYSGGALRGLDDNEPRLFSGGTGRLPRPLNPTALWMPWAAAARRMPMWART